MCFSVVYFNKPSLSAMICDVTVPAPRRVFSPSVSDPRCLSFCWWFSRPLPPPQLKLPRRIPPRASPGATRKVVRGTSCTAHAPPGASAGDDERGPRRCPAAAAPAPERRRAARCNDYPMDARVGREGEKHINLRETMQSCYWALDQLHLSS